MKKLNLNLLVVTFFIITVTYSQENTNYGTSSMGNVSSGYGNSAFGASSMSALTAGYRNTAVGFEAMTSGNGLHNTALGYHAFRAGLGNANVAIGDTSQHSAGSGGHNVSVGFNSMYYNTGDSNVGIGNSSLWQVSGSYNTMIGHESGHGVISGSYNVGMGRNVLRDVSSGSYNVALGHGADVSTGAASNQIVLGYEATAQADNSVTLGNANVTAVYMAEDSGAHIYAGDATFGGDVTISSDSRLKSNIVSLGATLSKLLLIDGKSYEKDGKQRIGVLAQEIQEVFPELVTEDGNEMLAVNYQGLVPVLINALKEQDEKINRLEKLVEKLVENQ